MQVASMPVLNAYVDHVLSHYFRAPASQASPAAPVQGEADAASFAWSEAAKVGGFGSTALPS